jgi:magnesium-transporting ATPase (P-type)
MTATRDSVSTETELIKFDDLAKSFGVEVEKGLSAGEASRRLTAGRNELPSPAGTSWIQRIWSHVREPMSLLLLSAALVSYVALRHPRDAAAISAIVVINVLCRSPSSPVLWTGRC